MEQRLRFDPVGRCIYCGSGGGEAGLSDEHIVPFSMGGQHVLPEASCENCQRITTSFEGDVAAVMFKAARIKNDFPTRRPKDRPTHLPMTQIEGEKKKTIYIPVKQALAIFPIIEFPPPGYMQEPQSDGTTEHWVKVHIKHLSYDPHALPRGARLTIQQRLPIDSYMRMLAKIGHSLCVAHYGYSTFDYWLPPYILGENPNISYVVGGFPPGQMPQLVPVNGAYTMSISFTRLPTGDWLVTANISLLPNTGMPPARVVVGSATDQIVRACFAKNS